MQGLTEVLHDHDVGFLEFALHNEHRLAVAQADLAYMFEVGRGVPLDYVAAYTWYSAAAAGGERHSSARLKSLAGVMLPAQLTLAKTQAVVCLAKHEKPAGTAEIQGAGGMSFLPEK